MTDSIYYVSDGKYGPYPVDYNSFKRHYKLMPGSNRAYPIPRYIDRNGELQIYERCKPIDIDHCVQYHETRVKIHKLLFSPRIK